MKDIPTPRTDEALRSYKDWCDKAERNRAAPESPVTPWGFARQLERELHQAREALREIKSQCHNLPIASTINKIASIVDTLMQKD